MGRRAPIVITISRQLASGGAYIGQKVAQRLSLRYVDRDILRQAADALGIADEREIEHLEERGRGLWAVIGRAVSIGPPEGPFVPPQRPAGNEADVLEVETRIIREIAAHQDAVIVGRGAAHLLRGEGVIRVYVHAPQPVRIAQVQRLYQLDEAAARHMVQQSDRDRARFVQSLVGRSWTDACLYDLTLDTSVVKPELAVDLIAGVVSGRQ